MEILHRDEGTSGSFYIKPDSAILAEMTYVWAGSEKIIIDHTVVSDVLKGKGIGQQLVSSAVLFAREKGIKVIPLCPFAKSVFEKVNEFHDVLYYSGG